MARNRTIGHIARDREDDDRFESMRFCSVGAAVSAVGVVSSIAGSRKQAKAQDNAAAQSAAAAEQQNALAQRQIAISERQQALSEEDRARYKTVYQPLEDKLIEESKDIGSIANQGLAATKSAAAVKAAYGGVRERLNKSLGVNPNSQAYLQAQNQINLQEAATGAEEQNKARTNAVDKGRSALSDAINIGRGLPSSAASALASAGSSASTAGSLSNNAANIANASAANVAKNTTSTLGGIGNALGTANQNGTLSKIGTTVSGWLGTGASTNTDDYWSRGFAGSMAD